MINYIGSLEHWEYEYCYKPLEYKIPYDIIFNTKNLLYDNSIKNNLLDAINIFKSKKTHLLPLDVKNGNNTKNDFGIALGKYGSIQKHNTSWVKQTRSYDENIKSINEDNIGFVVKTGKASNVMIIDLDKKTEWDENVHNMLKICLESKTLYSTTPSGGYHFYFLPTDKLPRTRKGLLNDNLDIRSKGGCGFYGYRNDGVYAIQNKNAEYKTIPSTAIDIIEAWDNRNNKNRNKINKALKALKSDGNQEPFKKLTDNNTFKTEPLSIYNINEETVLNLLDRLEPKYCDSYDEWIIIAVILKRYGLYDIYDTFNRKSESKYNDENNLKIYNALDPRAWVKSDFNINYIIILLNNQFIKNKKKYRLQNIEQIHHYYEPLSKENQTLFTTVINQQHLTDDIFTEGLKENKYIIVKSNLGTGKTYNTSLYSIKNEQPIISITHLKSLCESQVNNYNKINEKQEGNMKMIAYNDKNKSVVFNENSVCSTLNSLTKILSRITNIYDYVLYIDEINSIYNYTISSNTLNKQSRDVYNTLIDLIQKCKGMIGTSGDIDDNTIEWFKLLNINPKYILNTHKSFNNIPCKIYGCNKILLNKIKDLVKHHKYCTILSNTKKHVDLCYDILLSLGVPKDKIVIYTSDRGNKLKDVNTEWNNKYVLFSPTITEGIDRFSITPENVFVFYESEYSLTPLQVIQQICRNRNIKEVFISITCMQNEKIYDSYDACYNEHIEDTKHFKQQYMDINTIDLKQVYTPSTYTIKYINYVYNRSLQNANVKHTIINALEKLGFNVRYNILDDIDDYQDDDISIEDFTKKEILHCLIDYLHNPIDDEINDEYKYKKLYDNIKDKAESYLKIPKNIIYDLLIKDPNLENDILQIHQKTNETNETEEINETDEIDETDKIDEIDETDKIDEIDETAKKQILELMKSIDKYKKDIINITNQYKANKKSYGIDKAKQIKQLALDNVNDNIKICKTEIQYYKNKDRLDKKKMKEINKQQEKQNKINSDVCLSKTLFNILTKNKYFQLFLNIKTGFIHTNDSLKNNIYNDFYKTQSIKLLKTNKSNVLLYKNIMQKYLPEIDIYTFLYNEYDDIFLKNEIEMTDDDFKDIKSRLRSNKKKPITKLQCLKLIKQLLKLIVGDLLVCDQMEKRTKDKKIKYYVGGINTSMFKSYIDIIKYNLNDLKNIDNDILDNFINIENSNVDNKDDDKDEDDF